MNEVHAVIELKITPQRECGFGKIAQHISRFEQAIFKQLFSLFMIKDYIIFLYVNKLSTCISYSKEFITSNN